MGLAGTDQILLTRFAFDNARQVSKERIGGYPNTVRLLEVYSDQPPYYLEEEYVASKDLRIWCEAQGRVDKVPLETQLEIVAQAAIGFQAAHDAGVVHRDVKPGNVLDKAEGGLPSVARRAEEGGQRSEKRASPLGLRLVLPAEAGTPSLGAPEPSGLGVPPLGGGLGGKAGELPPPEIQRGVDGTRTENASGGSDGSCLDSMPGRSLSVERMQRVLFLTACLIVSSVVGASQSPPLVFSMMWDASAAVALDHDLFAVGNDQDNILRFYRVSQRGNPVHAYSRNPFLFGRKKSPEADLEGAARRGNGVYWITSHGQNAEGRPARRLGIASSPWK
jgi:hypothetical protein